MEVQDNPAVQEIALRLKEIKNLPLRLRIAEILREAILNGELKPGQPLVETKIAAQLQVSRAPVREGMRILSKEGLIETVPYKGTTVRTLTRQDIEELYSLREALETFAIRRIIASSEAPDFCELQTICQNMYDYAMQGNLHKLTVEDEKFHKAVITLAKHNLLTSVWANLSLRVRQIMSLRNQQNHNPLEVALNHPPIVEALQARDLDTALDLIHRHVLSAADLSLESWQESV